MQSTTYTDIRVARKIRTAANLLCLRKKHRGKVKIKINHEI